VTQFVARQIVRVQICNVALDPAMLAMMSSSESARRC
jgi:hypothetical protein